MSGLVPFSPWAAMAAAVLIAVSSVAYKAGRQVGAAEVRRATVVRVGDPYKGAYFGRCAFALRSTSIGSADLEPVQACATDQPEESQELPPGESITFGLVIMPGATR